jgi:non-homologous end joining protein Ku
MPSPLQSARSALTDDAAPLRYDRTQCRHRAAVDPPEFEDRYGRAVVEMLKAQAGRLADRAAARSRGANQRQPLDALRRSVEAEKRAATPMKTGIG